MKPLFTSGLKFLESLSFTRTLFAFDFDGTLSRIVPVPSDASVPETTSSLLTELSLSAPVAVLSGRGLADLRSRIGFRAKYLIANHGLEGWDNRALALEKAERLSRAWKAALERRLRAIPEASGIEIEDKIYSLALHYRRARGRKVAKTEIIRALSILSPEPKVIQGKCVVNLLPSGAPHKGAALLELMDRTGIRSGLYVGDDEEVFSLPDSRILTVRVGHKRSSQAQYFVSRQSDVNRLLRLLVRFHPPIARRAAKESLLDARL